MISGIRGRLVGRSGDHIGVETTSGVTYEIAVPLGVLERLPKDEAPVELLTVLVVREDGWLLFGFDRQQERLVFQRLLGASGVGPRLALALLSTLGGSRVIRALREPDIAALCTVPGIGKKTAERLILELKDRLSDLEEPGAAETPPPSDHALRALVNLGYAYGDADRAVRKAVAEDGNAEPAELIRRALHLLTKGR